MWPSLDNWLCQWRQAYMWHHFWLQHICAELHISHVCLKKLFQHIPMFLHSAALCTMAVTCKLCNHILCQLRCVLQFDQTSFLLRRYIRLLCSYFYSFPHTEAVTFGLHSNAGTLDCIVSFLISLHRSPCTIQSHVLFVYDMISRLVHVRYNLSMPHCMISISEPLLLRYLVLGEFRSLLT